jgi:hypothetical protein
LVPSGFGHVELVLDVEDVEDVEVELVVVWVGVG